MILEIGACCFMCRSRWECVYTWVTAYLSFFIEQYKLAPAKAVTLWSWEGNRGPSRK